MGSLRRNPIRSNFHRYAPPTVAREPGPKPARPARPGPPPVSLPEPDVTPRAAGHAFGLVVTIDGVGYALSVVPREPGDLALRHWSLAKLAGDRAVYLVSELPASEGFAACQCGDWHFRHEGNGTLCKHVQAIKHLRDRGLLAPLPWVLATDPDDLPDDPTRPGEPTWADLPEGFDPFDTSADGDPFDVTPMARKAAALEGVR